MNRGVVGVTRSSTVLAMRRFSAIMLLLGTACSGAHVAGRTSPAAWPSADVSDPRNPRVTLYHAVSTPISPVALTPFSDCDALLGYIRDEALKRVGSNGLPFYGSWTGPIAVDRPVPTAVTAPTRGSVTPQAAPMSPGYSTTNIQEAGVDEPDIVKNEGDHAVVFAAGRLRYIDLHQGTPREVGSIALATRFAQAQLLVSGTRVLAVSEDWGITNKALPASWNGQPRTVIDVIDASDPSKMREVTTLYGQGHYVSARLVNGVVRLVLASYEPSNVTFTGPADGTLAARRNALSVNRHIVATAPLDAWLPRYVMITHSARGARTYSGHLSSCGHISHPRDFSGFGMLNVMTIDPYDSTPSTSTSVIGAGEIVYSSPTHLYVATTRWPDTFDAASTLSTKTDIHEFDISDPQRAVYLASGTIPGGVLNQWSMSEKDGMLRVASTLGAPWNTTESSSSVYVLKQQAGLLAPVGHIGNLGHGERIYSVRFIGSLAFVVTYRQVDPLYVIDLRDPANPVERGSLKIEGFSAYLHPVADGLLLGIGQEVSADHTFDGGHVSLFDVSDPTSPKRLDMLKFANGTFANQDPQAFLYWPAKNLAVLSMSGWSRSGYDSWASAILVKNGSLHEASRIRHTSGSFNAAIERSFVSRDALYTMSEGGLMTSNLDTFARESWLPWTK